jgi:hypothetical protein
MIKILINNKEENSYLAVFCGVAVGILTICLILWNRLIRERLPREITGEIYSLTFWIILFLLILSVLQTIVRLYKLQKLVRGITGPTKNKLLIYLAVTFVETITKTEKRTKYLNFMGRYIFQAPLYLWWFIHFNMPFKLKAKLRELNFEIIMFLCDKIYLPGLCSKFSQFPPPYEHLIGLPPLDENLCIRQIAITEILLVYIPRILTFSVFFYEIAVNQELYYFYSVAIILLIPLIFSSFLRISYDLTYYSCRSILPRYIRTINNETINKDLGYRIFTKRNDSISDEMFQEASENYIYYERYIDLSIALDKFEKKYDIIYITIVSILFMLGLLFWLLIILKIY